ncbi:hypothetical protein HNR18_000260 [Pseudoclavibacter caeni]|nr:hypothetical protein [Pseudoclavibacter caeni]
MRRLPQVDGASDILAFVTDTSSNTDTANPAGSR